MKKTSQTEGMLVHARKHQNNGSWQPDKPKKKKKKASLLSKIPIIGGWVKTYKEYSKVTDLGPTVRRYFIIGSFDGALTILGVILGSLHSLSKELVITAGVAGGVALAVSSVVGAYEAERVENRLEKKELESAMLTEVKGSHEKILHMSAIISSLIHGAAPLIAAMIPVIPFLFLDVDTAVFASISITLTFLFVMGAYMGSLIRENIIYSGLRFIMVGILTAILTYFIGGGHPV